MRCPGCQVYFPESSTSEKLGSDCPADGPTHPYMLSSPACWATFGKLLALDYGNYSAATFHRLSVDTYAVQHPGVDGASARRSVATHLSRLYLLIERGWSIDRANQAMLRISATKDQRPWLEPPSMQGTLSIQDVLGSIDIEGQNQRVMAWANSVWQAWRPHHDTVREWSAALARRR